MNEVPYIVHESAMARMERLNKHQYVVILVLVIMLCLSNIGWMIYESQFEDFQIEAEQDGGGVNIVGGGDIDYGAESND